MDLSGTFIFDIDTGASIPTPIAFFPIWKISRNQINVSFDAFHASIYRNEMRINCANDINHRYTQKQLQ